MKTRVLIYAPTPPPFAGPEISTKLLLDNFKSDRIDLIYINSNIRTSNEKKGKLDFDGVNVFSTKITEIIKTIIKERPHKIYFLLSSGNVGFFRDSIIILIGVIFRKKLIGHYRGGNFHNFYKNNNLFFRKFIKYFIGKLDCVIVQANILKHMFEGLITEERINVLYNGIEKTGRSREYTGKDMITLLFIGHLAFSKGFYDLIKVYKKLFENCNLRLLYAGSKGFTGKAGKTIAGFLTGNDLSYFNENYEAISYEINEFIENSEKYNAKYLGKISGNEKEQAFKESDIFILPSYTEGFSMAVLEAMAYGLPVIVTKVGAFPEIVRDKINGLLIDKGSRIDIERILMLCTKENDLLTQISLNNVEYVIENFLVSKISNDFEKLLYEV